MHYHSEQLLRDPKKPDWPDRLLFSKGHACAMLYSMLAHRGFFDPEMHITFRSLDFSARWACSS